MVRGSGCQGGGCINRGRMEMWGCGGGGGVFNVGQVVCYFNNVFGFSVNKKEDMFEHQENASVRVGCLSYTFLSANLHESCANTKQKILTQGQVAYIIPFWVRSFPEFCVNTEEKMLASRQIAYGIPRCLRVHEKDFLVFHLNIWVKREDSLGVCSFVFFEYSVYQLI